MDERIQALIDSLADEATRPDELASLTDEQLDGIFEELRAAFTAGSEAGDGELSADDLRAVLGAAQIVRDERETRLAARAEAAAQAERDAAEVAELSAAVFGGPEDETEEGDAAGDGTDNGADEGDGEPTAATVPAAAPTPRQRASLAALAPAYGSRHAAPQRTPAVTKPRWQLLDGTAADFDDKLAIAQRMAEARNSLVGAPRGFADKVTVASLRTPYREEHRLVGSSSDDAYANDEKLETIVAAASNPATWDDPEVQNLVASGGWCAPLDPSYDIPTFASSERPVRDGLPRVGATRGGISFVRSPRLSLIVTGGPATSGAAITTWTAATDESPGDSVKRRQTFACKTIVEKDVDAIVARVRFGNLHGRAFPEDIAANLSLVEAAHARVAERKLLDDLISDINIDVTQAKVLGTARDVKHFLAQAGAEIRYTERMSRGQRLRSIVTATLLDQIPADVAFQQASGETDALFFDEAEARRLLNSVPGMNYIFALDTPTGADAFVTQADSQALADWPDDYEIPIFPEGSAVFLDGGELNLGVVRDSTLNDTNDYEVFMETFEAVAWRGPYGKTLTLTTCPTGDSQVATDKTGSLCSGS